MAEAPAPKKTLTETLELLEKQVQCPICLETYRDPKALACLHTYCRECIQQLLLRQQRDQEVECPQCRSVVAVAGNDPNSLPTVFFINGLIEVCEIMKKAESNEIACQSCCEAKAISFCHTCGFVHKKLKIFQGHQTVLISEMRKGVLIQLPAKKASTSTCQKHEGKRCKLYCFQCEQLICKDCTLVDHAGHKFDFNRGVAGAFRKEVLSSLVPLQNTQANLIKAIARMEGSKKEIIEQGANKSVTITQSYEKLHVFLKNREQVLQQQAQEEVGRKVNVLDRQKEDLQLAVATLDSLVGFIEKTAENASDEEFISMKQQMTSQVQQVSKKYKDMKLSPNEVLYPTRMGAQLVRKRSVLLLGNLQAGKSTIGNQLLGCDPLSSNQPFYVQSSVTFVTRAVSSAVAELYKDNILYNISVIDTVGFIQEEKIEKLIKGFFANWIHQINLVLFVFRKGSMTDKEQQVISFFMNIFDQDVSSISALAVTHCENDTAEARTAMVKEFEVNEETKRIAAQMEMGIYPVGFPPVKSMNPILQGVYLSQMEEDRSTLLDLVIRADKVFLSKNLFREKVRPFSIW